MKIYGGSDPREIGAYTVAEAAHLLGLSPSTLRSWVKGRNYPTAKGLRFFRPLIAPPSGTPPLLSFMNLVEAHVLQAIRRRHNIPLAKIRRSLEHLSKHMGSPRPLLEDLKTDDQDLFVERFGKLINLSRSGQLAMREILSAYLRRIKRDSKGRPVEFYPFSHADYRRDPAAIVINPRISFGKPIVRGTGVPTSVLAQRYKAGDSVETLAEDYEIRRSHVEEAIRYELKAA